jgi:hypothetical protein
MKAAMELELSGFEGGAIVKIGVSCSSRIGRKARSIYPQELMAVQFQAPGYDVFGAQSTVGAAVRGPGSARRLSGVTKRILTFRFTEKI